VGCYFYNLSMNEKHQNGLCPRGDNIWCKFKTCASPRLACQHKHSLLPAVMDAIKPVFKNLVSVDLLKRCLYGTTRNRNEGEKSVIWTRIPKRLETLRFGVYDAVLCFNNDDVRGGADKSLARPTSRYRRTESIVSLERAVSSYAELQFFSCYRE